MILLGVFSLAAALMLLYLKYRVVLTGERCKGKITGIAEQRGGYAVGGVAVRKRAYLVKIRGKQYYTAHGCLFLPLGRKKIGKEICVSVLGHPHRGALPDPLFSHCVLFLVCLDPYTIV